VDRRVALRADLVAAHASFHALLDALTDADLRRPSRNPGWTNGEVLWHMVFGFVILAALAPLVRFWGRLPRRYAKRIARVLNGVLLFTLVPVVATLAGGVVATYRTNLATTSRLLPPFDDRSGPLFAGGVMLSCLAIIAPVWSRRMHLPPFLPHLKGLRLAEITTTDEGVTLHLYATRRTAPCPSCRRRSRRVHSRYDRTIVDLPWGGTTIRLRLRVRRFVCQVAPCPQRIFAEQVPHLVDRYGRRTHRLRAALQQIGLALGGAAGARLAVALGLPVGRTALLGLIRAAPLPDSEPPEIVGVDEFAWRRGQRFGTIIVDLEHRRPIDLLPDRDADHVAAWLQRHPGITTVARDRSGLYADAAARGAPAAQQVVDRWHLLHNLGDALEQFLLHKRAVLREAAGALTKAPGEVPAAELPALPWQQRAEEAGRQRHAAQLAHYEAIHRLHEAGADIAHIARTVGVSRETAYRYLRLPGPPARMRLPARRAALDPYLPYLERRWAEGCRNGKRLWREIREQGFARSYSSVARVVARLRRAERASQPTGATRRTAARPPTPRQVAMLCLRHPQKRTPAQRAYLGHLQQADEAVASAYTLTQDFAAMLRERRGERLDAWLAEAEACPVPALRRFATGLRGDLDAVRAGLSEPWSNGPTEGYVHKRKLLKRQGYGRAGFDLLRQRVLCAA